MVRVSHFFASPQAPPSYGLTSQDPTKSKQAHMMEHVRKRVELPQIAEQQPNIRKSKMKHTAVTAARAVQNQLDVSRAGTIVATGQKGSPQKNLNDIKKEPSPPNSFSVVKPNELSDKTTKVEDRVDPFQHLPNDVVLEIMEFLGPVETANCSNTCRRFYSISQSSPKLWKYFVDADFQLEPIENITPDWRAIYVFLKRKLQRMEHFRPQSFLVATVHSTDGGRETGRDSAENALSPLRFRPWSTAMPLHKNVNLTADLSDLCLITGFACSNHCPSCTCPLNEALVFTSANPPDLEDRAMYNGEKGPEWVQRLESQTVAKAPTRVRWRGKENRVGTVANQMPTTNEPKAAFKFPDAPECYRVRLYRQCARPVVARFVHFKLLSSFNPRNLPPSHRNIDVNDLHTYGVTCPELSKLLQTPLTSEL